MAERIDEEGGDMERLPPEEVDNDSDDDVDRLFELMHEGEEDEEEEVEDEQPLDTEASESFELDTPAERSGHIAVIDRNIMFVWGGYKVRRSLYVNATMTTVYHLSGYETKFFSSSDKECPEPQILWLIPAEKWDLGLQHRVGSMVIAATFTVFLLGIWSLRHIN